MAPNHRELEALLSLLYARSGLPQLRPFIETHGDAESAWRALQRRPRTRAKLEQIEERVRSGIATIEAVGAEVVTLPEARYPERLRHLNEDAPYVLFARGNLELWRNTTLAIVGSRRCSDYGADAARTLSGAAARAGAVIVSGMALGIDGIAHEAALEAGGSTIAVFGCGIDICYPPRHRRLYEQIGEHGLLLTEFAPGTPPMPHHFPHRNRIIALLSHAVLVVEATSLSGSLSTAARARDHMDILAVPGPIGRPSSEGCHALIRDGATIVLSTADVLNALHLAPPETPSSRAAPVILDEDARRVWKSLSYDGRHLDEIALRSRMNPSAVTHALLQLELAGQIRQLPGSRFSLTPQRQ
jgi:DNA processing protein